MDKTQNRKNMVYRLYSCMLIVIVCCMGMSQTVNASENKQISKVMITKDNIIQFEVDLEQTPHTDNNRLYLFELQPFEYEIPSEAEPIVATLASRYVKLKFSYAKGRIYKKFALAGYVNGKMMVFGIPQYITNPEVLAKSTKPRKERYEFCTQTKGMANISLNGKGGINVTVNTIQVLNSGKNKTVTHPLARKDAEQADTNTVEHHYYMLNAAEKEGIEAITNELSWYAKNTQAQDFIIGNEVNQRVWNYMAFIPWEDFVREYVNLYRVCYNAIKSTNENARVYISLDGNWNRNRALDHWEYHTYIDAKDFLDIFAATTSAEGNIDWGLSIHPYIVPLDYAKFWDYSEHPDGDYMIEQITEKKMYSFQNMTMVTDYMLQNHFLNPNGEVRDIIINELGVDRSQGDEVQAAAICASYVAFMRNPYVTQYMYLDTAGYGVDLRVKGKAKKVIQNLGTSNEQTYLDWALEYIGAENWDEILDLYPENDNP